MRVRFGFGEKATEGTMSGGLRDIGSAAELPGGVIVHTGSEASGAAEGPKDKSKEASKSGGGESSKVDARVEKHDFFVIANQEKDRLMKFVPQGTNLFFTDVHWQWEHRTGFKDYSQEESDRIEEHFQRGDWLMRMKSGKGKNAKPREIFFYDMVQLDPTSNSLRNIKRVPELNRWEKCMRRAKAVTASASRGEQKWWLSKSKKTYEEQREDKTHQTEGQKNAQLFRVEGCWYRIGRTWTFNSISVLAILGNAVWLFFDADMNRGTSVLDTDWVWIIGENIFCVWFSLELLVRYMAFNKTKYIFKDSWFMLDLVLVILMILETWVLQLGVYVIARSSRSANNVQKFSVLRSLRLMRLARITRLFRIFPELFVLLKGVIHAMRALLYTMMMLLVITFVWGVIFSNFAKQDDDLKDAGYSSVLESMWILLLYGVLLDAVADALTKLKEISMTYATLFLVFIFLSNLTMLNMLVGILCEVVSRVTQEENDTAARQELELSVTEILECYDVNDNGRIQRGEFQQMMSNPDLAMILRRHDIEMNDLVKLEDVLFESPEGTDEEPCFLFSEFLEKVFQLRGGNMSTVNDIVELRGFVSKRINHIEERLNLRPHIGGFTSESDEKPEPPSLPAIDETLLGQIRTPMGQHPMGPVRFGGGSTSSDTFQAAVLTHLTAIRDDQQTLRKEVMQMHDQVQELHDQIAGFSGKGVSADNVEQQSC